MVLAQYEIFQALFVMEDMELWAKVTYSVVFGLIVLLAIGKDLKDYTDEKRGIHHTQYPSKIQLRQGPSDNDVKQAVNGLSLNADGVSPGGYSNTHIV